MVFAKLQVITVSFVVDDGLGFLVDDEIDWGMLDFGGVVFAEFRGVGRGLGLGNELLFGGGVVRLVDFDCLAWLELLELAGGDFEAILSTT
jgi:hypothetical protein